MIPFVWFVMVVAAAVALVRHIVREMADDRARRRRLAAGFDACQRAWAAPEYSAAERKAAVDRLLDGNNR